LERFYTLNKLHPGESARVRRLNSKGGMRRRMLDMGIVVGTLITCLSRSSAGGTAAYRIRGAVIAIRDEDSRDIVVAPEVEHGI